MSPKRSSIVVEWFLMCFEWENWVSSNEKMQIYNLNVPVTLLFNLISIKFVVCNNFIIITHIWLMKEENCFPYLLKKLAFHFLTQKSSVVPIRHLSGFNSLSFSLNIPGRQINTPLLAKIGCFYTLLMSDTLVCRCHWFFFECLNTYSRPCPQCYGIHHINVLLVII